MKSLEIVPIKKEIVASVAVPGSKSYTNRGLLLSAMTKRKVHIKNPLKSDDTDAMIDCLTALGIEITKTENEIVVHGNTEKIKNKHYRLNAHLSGTVIRFLLALCSVIPGQKYLTGDEGLNKRPISELVEALRKLGSEIEYIEREGYPPVLITSNELTPGKTQIKGNISSQFFSAILMIAPVIGEITIDVIGEQISKPYIDMTIDVMKHFGVKVINMHYKRYIIPGNQEYIAREYKVEGDYSSAGYFFALAALTGSTITVENLNPTSLQADKLFLMILEQMGSKVTWSTNSVTVEGNGIKPVDVDMISCPDQAQSLAVLAAFAPGTTVIRGIQSLRFKETERVAALQAELKKMGIDTDSTEETLTIYGGSPKCATIDTYGDHRMAMSFAIAGTVLPGMVINNPEVVNKTFPEYWNKLKQLGVKLRQV